MIQQLTLDADTISERFDRFHHAHPEVYDELVALARQATSRGRTKLGISQLFEVLRWQRMIAGLPDQTESFKLNNSYRSRYSRLIMDNEPDLADIFETRALTAL